MYFFFFSSRRVITEYNGVGGVGRFVKGAERGGGGHRGHEVKIWRVCES